MSQTVLFICTGNYYRSRFAEAIFNHQATSQNLPWRAFSRGLAIHLAPSEPPISEHTRERLEVLQIPAHHTAARAMSLAQDDLHHADLVVALQDTEHRPMVREQFPDWVNRITFWEVPDIGFRHPSSALQEIEDRVTALIQSLK